MKTLKHYLGPLCLLTVFVIIMTLGEHLWISDNEKDAMSKRFQEIEKGIQQEQWDSALESTKSLHKTWDKVAGKLQFGLEKDILLGFKEHLSFLEGAIDGEDVQTSTLYLAVLEEEWHTISD